MANLVERTKTPVFLYSFEYEVDPVVVHWPAFKHPTGPGRGGDMHLTFDVNITEGKRQRETQCDFWQPFFLRTITGAVPAFVP